MNCNPIRRRATDPGVLVGFRGSSGARGFRGISVGSGGIPGVPGGFQV